MIYDNKLNDEQTVKKAIKEALHEGMRLVSCKSCGETWFVPGNVIESAFICNKCIIQKQQEGGTEMTRDGIYAGARAILIDHSIHRYRIVEFIANKVNLTEEGLFFAVKDVKTGEIIGAKFIDLRFGSNKQDKEDGHLYTIDEWISANAEGYICDYDGTAYFYDDEYVYYRPDPFNPAVFEDDVADYFSGVMFYGK